MQTAGDERNAKFSVADRPLWTSGFLHWTLDLLSSTKKKKNCVGYFLIIQLMWTVRQLSGYLPLKDFLYLTVVIIQYNGCA